MNVRDFRFTMQQEEIWKDIPDYEGLYQVSNFGRVKRLPSIVRSKSGGIRHAPERILNPIRQTLGYLTVKLSKDGIVRSVLVHRIVAQAFVLNPNGYAEVNHKDENKTNNRADNLEWCSRSYNINYGTRSLRQSIAMTDKNGRKVKCYSNNGLLIGIFDGIKMASRLLKLPNRAFPNIIKCCKGEVPTAYGYKWEYADAK